MTALEFSYKVDQLTSSLKPFALKLTKDMEDANDLLQETILKASILQEGASAATSSENNRKTMNFN